MTDWTKSTGAYGVMMIRDTGSTVEFWLKGNSSTYNYNLPWRYTINGSTSSWRSYSFGPSNNYQRLGSWNITTSQTVTFYLGDTNTYGLGGPTTFSHAISRGGGPAKPTLKITSYTDTTINVNADNNGSGGSSWC